MPDHTEQNCLCQSGELIRIGTTTTIHVKKVRNDEVFLCIQSHAGARIMHLLKHEVAALKRALKTKTP